ncbi:MAG: lysophospholipid transporter LplT, partial [Gammaproteobacteria bacterium]|nr:lysophospholipid transporter LplT [Gammaproteobacteria bacterium]NIT63826.1 lysophospholipid transporter LplT [Gammaproteobacteria bacterium]NIX10364.1 lysophospholipid transporter LplT [Gammaproteobacteria bacterium]NIY32406.1 lysophospholipid transporter LplT [Gammaproteobacteria bacterium]
TTDIAVLSVYIAVGIALGAVVVPRLIPIERLRRARMAAYWMGLFIILLSVTESPWAVKALLLVVGMAGGMFVVPINAALQEIGHRTIGSGGAVAIQNFFENLAMLGGTA